MKKTVLTFGLISGALLSMMMLATLPFLDRIGFDKGEVIGYTTMVLSFLFVYFGIKSYRDNVGGGTVGFRPGVRRRGDDHCDLERLLRRDLGGRSTTR